MDRPPRNAQTDRLVNFRLISFAYFQIGMIQALAGFFTYMLVLNDYGYTPSILMGNGLKWFDNTLMCTYEKIVDTDNGVAWFKPKSCGFGCEDAANDICKGGCAIPVDYSQNPQYVGEKSWFLDNVGNSVTVDPFIEFDSNGFRGETAYTCNRACATRSDAANSDLVSTAEGTAFGYFCGLTGGSDFGFDGRGYANKDAIAPAGAFYWWNGAPQVMPNVDYQTAALEYAQTAYFITIIIVQWADLLIAKTRKLSVFEQGMGNDFMNFGLIFETVLGATLCYTPAFNQVFGTRPLHILHWFSGVPWSMLIFFYDEIRKAAIRANPGGWLDRWTYW